MQVKKSIVCGLQKGVRVAIYFFLDLFGAERCSDLEVKRYSSLPCRSSIEKQLQTVKVCVKSRKRNRNNGMTDNLSSLFHSQPANISKHSSPRPKHSSALHGAMASLQSTLNVQAFCFPFPFHGINQTAKAKKVVALQA
jgi:hypothetical protein